MGVSSFLIRSLSCESGPPFKLFRFKLRVPISFSHEQKKKEGVARLAHFVNLYEGLGLTGGPSIDDYSGLPLWTQPGRIHWGLASPCHIGLQLHQASSQSGWSTGLT